MDYGFVSSPSLSPNQSLFSQGQYFESTSESSSPNSPHVSTQPVEQAGHTLIKINPQMNQMMFNNTAMDYQMFNSYNNNTRNSTSFYTPQPTRMPIEYTGSSTLDERDRRRRRSGSTSTSKEKEAVPNMHLRRRAQNRASQRAFRERKEKHVKGLEHQLEDLHEKHQDLLQSYTRQADEVSKLTGRIAQLNAELESLRTCADQSFSELLMPEKFEKFDAFSGGHEMYYNGPDCYFEKHAADSSSEFALNSFEDSL